MDVQGVLGRLGRRELAEELVQALAITAEEVVATGKAGKVTLTLTVSNKGPGDVMVCVEEKLSRAAPAKDAKGAYFFSLDGQLFAEDPRQGKLDLRTVDTETGEIRNIKAPERVERTV